MEKLNNEMSKKNNEIIPQSMDEIESLNDSDELDIESLEKISAADGCIIRGKNGGCFIRWEKSQPISQEASAAG